MKGLIERFKDWRRQRRIQQITLDNARERAQRGAEYLDEHDPGWYQRVDADALELADGASCVLGQLHGDFRLGLGRSQMINLSSAPRASLSPIAYGFKCVQHVPDTWQERDYRMLNRAWREEVEKREAAADPRGDGYAGAELPEVRVRNAPKVDASSEDVSLDEAVEIG